MNFGGLFDIDQKKSRINELEKKSQSPDFWNDQRAAQKIINEANSLKLIVNLWQEQSCNLEDVSAILELGDDPDLTKEAEEKINIVEKNIGELEFRKMLSGEHDKASAILSINAGAGGTESCDWAGMLLRMYRRWADIHKYKNEFVEFTPGDEAGFRSVTLTIEGEYAYGYLKAEIGVHRLVRISPFDSNKRRHTSFASVFVIPDIEDDIEIEIIETDLRIDTFRSGGAGGQHVNTTDSAVRLTHLPTGIVVACQAERSQHQNKERAMKVLKAKLYDHELQKKLAEKEVLEKTKKKNEWGSQIRSYVMHPYRMIKDHRTDMETGNVDAVMDGNLDDFIKKFLLEF